jgi:ribonuclease-3
MITAQRQQSFAELEAIIDYKFASYQRLDRALTHSSARDPESGNYERLEFLGDRILGLCIAELLFGRFGDADEGELSVRLNNLVSAEACAVIAGDLNLHQFILTGADIKNVNASNMLNVRADVIEALIAAIYLDGGLPAARDFILKFWTKRALAKSSIRRDAKTELQEWAHAQHKIAPIYKIISRDGPDHAPLFTVEVSVKSLPSASGKSGSKRAAEQVAAQAMLLRQGVWTGENQDD